jgi:hypothetical protein
VFLRGTVWDVATQGYSFAVADGHVAAETQSDDAALINLWL